MAKSEKNTEEICKKIDALFKEAGDFRKQYHGLWEECEKFYNSSHWPDGVKRPYENHVFRIVESETPVLTDSRPSTDVIAIDPEKEYAARLLDTAKDHVYRSQALNLKDAMSIRSLLKTGNAYQYVDFDPDLNDGEGDVIVKNIPWRQCFPDPTANEIQECRFFGFRFPMDKEDVKRRFPKAKEIQTVKPNGFLNNNSTDPIGEDRNLRNINSDGESVNRYDGEGLTTLDEMWMKDYSMENIEDEETQEEIVKESMEIQNGKNPDISKYEDHQAHKEGHEEQIYIIAAEMLQIPVEQVTEDDLENLKQDEQFGLIFQIALDHIAMHESYIEAGFDEGQRPVYKDNMRLVIKVGEQILYDGGNPYEDGMYPVAPFHCYKNEDDFYATGEIQNILPLQKSLNEMLWSEYKGLKLVSNPGWIVDENSGVDEDTLTNEEGIVVMKKQGTEAQRLEPGQVSPQLPGRKESDKNAMLEISGMNETTMGEAPSGDPSGVAIQKLQQQAIGRIRLKSRGFEEYSLKIRDKLIISRIIKFYSTERKLRIDDDFGQVSFIDFDPEEIKDLQYDLLLSKGTSAGLDKEAVYQIMNGLKMDGTIDAKTFVQAVDIPQKSKILQNIEERDEMTAALEQLQQENLQLKAELAPQLLTPEEIELLEQQ